MAINWLMRSAVGKPETNPTLLLIPLMDVSLCWPPGRRTTSPLWILSVVGERLLKDGPAIPPGAIRSTFGGIQDQCVIKWLRSLPRHLGLREIPDVRPAPFSLERRSGKPRRRRTGLSRKESGGQSCGAAGG